MNKIWQVNCCINCKYMDFNYGEGPICGRKMLSKIEGIQRYMYNNMCNKWEERG